MAILAFAHILWEATKPTIVLTDNKSVMRFLQTKAILRELWNSCDYVLQFNFEEAHIAGSTNTAADFLFSLELKVTEEIRLKVSEDIQKTRNEVKTTFSDVANEEQFFVTQTDDESESEEKNPLTERTISAKRNGRGCRQGTVQIEN